MSLTRTFNWFCDHPECAPISPERHEEPGLPKGWISTVAVVKDPEWNVVKHFCPGHRDRIDRKYWHPSSLEKYPQKP